MDSKLFISWCQNREISLGYLAGPEASPGSLNVAEGPLSDVT